MVPNGWNYEKASSCLRLARTDSWAIPKYAVEKSDIQEHYNDPLVPVSLRIAAEPVLLTALKWANLPCLANIAAPAKAIGKLALNSEILIEKL